MANITIVVPFFKELDQINNTVQSVALQDYWQKKSGFEILICNDGPHSKDEILAVIDKRLHENIRILNNRGEKGPGPARNIGINNAKFEYIAFLDADDIWHENKISLQMEKAKKGYNFICTGYFLGEKVKITPPKKIKNPFDIYIKRGLGSSTILVTKELVGKKRFTSLRYSQDIEFWYKLSCSHQFKYYAVNKYVVKYSRHGSTKNKFTQLIYFYKSMQRNNIVFFKRLFAMLSYIIIGIRNHYLRS